MHLLLTVWPRACSLPPTGATDPVWQAVGASDFGPDDSRGTELPGGGAARRVRLPEGGGFTLEWTDDELRAGATSIHQRTWTGAGWREHEPVPFAREGARERLGPWAERRDEQLVLWVDGAVRELPEPPRPTLLGSSCTGGSRTAAYRGPRAVAADRDGRVVFAETIGESVNVWRWSGGGWSALGPAVDVAPAGGRGRLGRLGPPPAIAFDGAGEPVVAWYTWSGERGALHVQRWRTGGWAPLPPQDSGRRIAPLRDYGEQELDSRSPPRLVTRGDDVVVAVVAGGEAAVAVAGGAWTVSAPLDPGAHVLGDPALAVLPDGRVLAAWTREQRAEWSVRAATLDGGTWTPAGEWPVEVSHEALPQLDPGEDGLPLLTFTDTDLVLLRWDGARLAPLVPAPDVPLGLARPASAPSLVVDDAGRPSVAWGPYLTWLRTWTGSAWSVPTPTPGSAGQPLRVVWGASGPELAPAPPSTSEGADACLGASALARDGGFAFTRDGATGALRACRFDGAEWTPLPDVGAAAIRSPVGAFDGLVAWVEPSEVRQRVHVSEWTGDAWVEPAGPAVECAGRCTGVAVARGGGRTCVAWTERAGLGVRCRTP